VLIPLDGSAFGRKGDVFATALSISTATHLVLVRAATTHSGEALIPLGRGRMPRLRPNTSCSPHFILRSLGGAAAGLAAGGFVVETATPLWRAASRVDPRRGGPTQDLRDSHHHARSDGTRPLVVPRRHVAEEVVSRTRFHVRGNAAPGIRSNAPLGFEATRPVTRGSPQTPGPAGYPRR